jgi:hypothetical protein
MSMSVPAANLMAGQAALNELLSQRKEAGYHPDDMDYHYATTIFKEWLA